MTELSVPQNYHPDDEVHPMMASVRRATGRGLLGRVASGFWLPLKSARFLMTQPKLWSLVVWPALINLVLFVGAAFLLVTHVDAILGWMWAKPALAAWYDWILVGLWWIAAVLLGILGLVVSYFLVIIVGAVVASPFNDALSRRAERILLGPNAVGDPDISIWREAARATTSSIAVMGLYLAFMVPAFGLSFIPVAGKMIYAVLTACISAFFLALEYTGPPLVRREIRLGRRVSNVRKNWPMTASFGLGISVLLWIPLLNFLCIPLAVIGGTALGIAIDGD